MARNRRGRGEGSIFQRSDGLWTASVSAGYNAKGKRQRHTVYGHTKAEVREKLLKLQADASKGIVKDVDRLKMSDFLDRWLAVIKPTVEPNTYGPYERHCRLHLKPYIGTLKILKLAAFHVEELYAALNKNDVSPALARKIGTTLTIALNEAVRSKVLPYNPSLGVRKPKAAKPEIVVFDPEQVGIFLRAAEAERLFALYVFAFDTGMRPGELFALEWPDVDFESGHVQVTKSLEDIGGHLRVKDVKTKKGRRRIDLSQQTLTALHEHRKHMLVEGHAAGPVFCNTIGGHIRISDFHKEWFKPILHRAGLPTKFTPYSMRHTCATLLLLVDVNAKIVSERLGHSTIQQTLDTYSHVLPTMQKGATEKMNAILGQCMPKTGSC